MPHTGTDPGSGNVPIARVLRAKAAVRKRAGGSHPTTSPAETVGEALEFYASKSVFKGFSCGPRQGTKAAYKMLWHADRVFEITLDTAARTLGFAILLPTVPAKSSMYASLKAFIGAFSSDVVPEHRRIDRDRAEIKPVNRRGDVTLLVTVKDGDYDYAVRKLIHLVHEVYLVFLLNGIYFDYRVEHLGLDIDAGGGL